MAWNLPSRLRHKAGRVPCAKGNTPLAWISPTRLRLAARQLRQGKLLAYPTESVWGLGCDPANGPAVTELLALKGRATSKGLILIAATYEQIEPFMDLDDQNIQNKMLASWPGPVTWVVKAAPATPHWLRGKRDTLAVRVTAHPVAKALCLAFGGAIVSTSANRSGACPARTQLKTRIYFKHAQLNYMPGSVGGLERPTSIFDARTGIKLR